MRALHYTSVLALHHATFRRLGGVDKHQAASKFDLPSSRAVLGLELSLVQLLQPMRRIPAVDAAGGEHTGCTSRLSAAQSDHDHELTRPAASHNKPGWPVVVHAGRPGASGHKLERSGSAVDTVHTADKPPVQAGRTSASTGNILTGLHPDRAIVPVSTSGRDNSAHQASEATSAANPSRTSGHRRTLTDDSGIAGTCHQVVSDMAGTAIDLAPRPRRAFPTPRAPAAPSAGSTPAALRSPILRQDSSLIASRQASLNLLKATSSLQSPARQGIFSEIATDTVPVCR